MFRQPWSSFLCILSIAVTFGCNPGPSVLDDCVGDCTDGMGGNIPPTSTSLRGVFFSGQVSGLAFETDTLTGVTDSQGAFFYEPGEAVTFRVGNTRLGEVAGAPEVTPFDLVEQAAPITRTPRLMAALGTPKHPLRQVLNIVVFLKTLDVDADSTNGIEIPPVVLEVFDDVDVDFAQSPISFPRTFALREALARANGMSTFTSPHGVASPAHAMQHLYETLSIDPEIFYASTIASVSPDGSNSTIWSDTFDDDGKLVRRDSDSFDTEGNPGPDGIPDAALTWSYNDDAKLLVYARLGNEFSPTRTETLTYDGVGNVTSHIIGNDAGAVFRVQLWEYDGNGSVLRHETDENGDGIAEQIATLQYDPQGNRILRETDFNADDEPERVETWEYDESGYLVRSTSDRDNDGSPNRIVTYENDEEGRPLVQREDADGNGEAEDVVTFEYDADGNLTRRVRDDDDNTRDLTEEWIYDATGEVTERRADPGSDSVAVQILRNTYDATGRLTRVDSDSDGDGYIDAISRWMYDAEGNLLRFERDTNGDLTPDRLEIATYDAFGNQITFERQDTDQPVFDQKITRTFERQGWGMLMGWLGIESYVGARMR